MNIIPTMKYFFLTVKHKWFVFLAGLKTKAPIWNLIIHDWSKFLPSELPHYGRQFFGKANDPLGFTKCWLHHQNANPHHWEYWIPRTGHNRGGFQDNLPLPIPEKYVREMIADWIGASRAYEGKWPTKDNWKWFDNNFDKIVLFPHTRELIETILLSLHLR